MLRGGTSNSARLSAGARRSRRARTALPFGQPFTLPGLDHRPRGRDLSAYTCLIMTHIAALTEPRHRGVYADTPGLRTLLAGEDPWPCCRAEQTAETPAA